MKELNNTVFFSLPTKEISVFFFVDFADYEVEITTVKKCLSLFLCRGVCFLFKMAVTNVHLPESIAQDTQRQQFITTKTNTISTLTTAFPAFRKL